MAEYTALFITRRLICITNMYIEASADCKVIALVVFPMSFPENWSGYFGKKSKLKKMNFYE